jgi:uncharacterized membrane protein YhaH (DUF805 family)
MKKFDNSLGSCLAAYWTNYAGWGRATRSEYWWSFLFYSVIALGALQAIAPALAVFASLAFIVPGFCVGVRRLHDTNRSAWNLCWLLLPIVGLIIFIVYLCQKSNKAKNKFGPARI